MSKLLENKNALPFEAQNHCKLRLEEIADIQTRFENGESLTQIHLDYPQVSYPAIRYWAVNREEDLARRKQEESYIYDCHEKPTKSYLTDLYNRRKEAGLPVNNYSYSPVECPKRNLTGVKLTDKVKEEIVKDYETLEHTTYTLSEKYNVPKTIVQSTLQSKNYNKRFKEAKQKKIDNKHLNYLKVFELSETKSNEEISKLTNFSEKYVATILSVCRNPYKYIDNKYNGTSLQAIAKTFLKEEI